jgi:hypothetical protein
MKKIFIGSVYVMLCYSGNAQTKLQDSTAILIIDRMTDMIGDLQSCSYKLHVLNDVWDTSLGLIKQFDDYEVYMSDSNKVMVNAYGHKGHRQFLYNGQQLGYYSYDEHNYGVIPAPSTTLQMIDSVNTNYGIEFPAADFFYPAFTDDLLEQADTVRFLGKEEIEGKEFFHIMAIGKDVNFQFWVNNDAYNLPAKFVITYKHMRGSPQYIASFSDWQINPALPSAMFDFLPPPGAAQVRIMSKTDR